MLCLIFYKVVLDTLGKGEFGPHNDIIDWAADIICPADVEIEKICRDVIFLICGFDSQNLNLV